MAVVTDVDVEVIGDVAVHMVHVDVGHVVAEHVLEDVEVVIADASAI